MLVVAEVVDVVVEVEVVVEPVMAVDVDEEVLGCTSLDVVVVIVDAVGAFGAGRLSANHIPPIPCPLVSPAL